MTGITKKELKPSVNTREQAETALADLAATTAKIDKLNAKMDDELTKVRDKYADDLTKLEENCKSCKEVITNYAVNNRADFKGKKTITLVHGSVSLKVGKPKLTIQEGEKWENVLVLVKEELPDYVRQTEEVAKDKILADCKDGNLIEKLTKVGIMVVQEETCIIKPKNQLEGAA